MLHNFKDVIQHKRPGDLQALHHQQYRVYTAGTSDMFPIQRITFKKLQHAGGSNCTLITGAFSGTFQTDRDFSQLLNVGTLSLILSEETSQVFMDFRYVFPPKKSEEL